MASLFRRREKAAAQAAVPVRPDLRWADLSGFIGPRYATYVTGTNHGDPQGAVTGSVAVYACVSLLADVIGSLPVHIFRKTDDGRERVDYSTADRALRGRRYPGSLARLMDYPNPEMTGQQFFSTVVGHCGLWGNFYAEIMRDAEGRVESLWPMRPDRMEIRREDGRKVYRYHLETDQAGRSRKVVDFAAEKDLHIPAFGTDGMHGISPISVARKAIEGESAAEGFVTKWYENGAVPSVIARITPGPPEGRADRAKALGNSLRSLYAGKENIGKVAVITNDIEWEQLSMPMNDMQFVETRKFALQQVATLYRIPHYLFTPEVTSSWGSGVEQQFLGMLTLTLRPILARIENAVDRDCGLVPGEKVLGDEGLYAEFQTAELLRTDTKTRMEAYEVGIRSHVLLPNEARAAENLPRVEGGDEFPTLQGQADTTPAEPAEPTPEENARTAFYAAMTTRALDPQQMQLPEITVSPPSVTTFNRQMEEGELAEFASALPAPVVNVDTRALAKILAQAEARRILDAEKAEERAERRHAEQMAALTATRRKQVQRDEDGKIAEVIELYGEAK